MRSAIQLAVLALAITVMAAYSAAAEGGVPQKPKHRSTFTMTAQLHGLYPSARRSLTVTVKNRNRFAIRLRGFRASVANPSRRCRATALVVGGYKGGQKVKPRKSVRIRVPIRMSWTATNGCKGATFGLTFTGKASR